MIICRILHHVGCLMERSEGNTASIFRVTGLVLVYYKGIWRRNCVDYAGKFQGLWPIRTMLMEEVIDMVSNMFVWYKIYLTTKFTSLLNKVSVTGKGIYLLNRFWCLDFQTGCEIVPLHNIFEKKIMGTSHHTVLKKTAIAEKGTYFFDIFWFAVYRILMCNIYALQNLGDIIQSIWHAI